MKSKAGERFLVAHPLFAFFAQRSGGAGSRGLRHRTGDSGSGSGSEGSREDVSSTTLTLRLLVAHHLGKETRDLLLDAAGGLDALCLECADHILAPHRRVGCAQDLTDGVADH